MEEDKSFTVAPEPINHGWQKVTYAKKQRKTQNKKTASDSSAILPNGSGVLPERSGVFKGLEKHAEERRRKLEAQRASAVYDDDDEIPRRSKNTRGEDEDDDDVNSDANVKTNVTKVNKEKPKKVKMPKVSGSEAAAKIDADDLTAFLASVSESYEGQQDIQLMRMPKKSKRHRRSLRYLPLTFSPFARSMAMAISSKKSRQEIQLESKDFSVSFVDGFLNHGKDKTEQSKSSDSEEDEGVVHVDFTAFDPKPSDFHGMRVLLQTYLDNKQWDLSGFVDLILGQPVGTVIKTENDEDDGVYSFVTALNLRRYEDRKCIIELKDYLFLVCRDMDVIAKLRSLVGEHAQDVGLMVSQRVVNLPPQLLPKLYDALFDEVKSATENEPTEELRSSFRFKFYLIISRIYKHKNADQDKGTTKSGDESIIYTKPEDELFFEISSWSFTFPLHAQQVTTNELKNYRSMGLVMAVEASKVSIFREQLHSLIDE